MNRNFLLTYRKPSGEFDFDWFETIEEMESFIKRNPDFEIVDKVKIIQSEDLPT